MVAIKMVQFEEVEGNIDVRISFRIRSARNLIITGYSSDAIPFGHDGAVL